MSLREGSLVLYKNRPALVKRVGRKLEIALEDGGTLSVRPKDVTPLHPGPIQSFDELQPLAGEIATAWEILAGKVVSLADLAELAYGNYTPAAAWAAWQLVDDGLYFHGTPEEVTARPAQELAQERADREAKRAQDRSWAAFVERMRAGQFAVQDRPYLEEVESVALGRRDQSRVLRELGRAERPETAHALLIEVGYWDRTVNPYPQRLRMAIDPPDVVLPELPNETRIDLTHLAAFAIDDEGNQDPDDALSLEGDRLWVHVADVGALVVPESAADREARARGANLYLPERTVPMLPPKATEVLGLGLSEISPALSFGLDLTPGAEVLNVEVVPSWVRVTRLTYAEADARLREEPFLNLYRLAKAHEARRREGGAVFLELPEVDVSVEDGEVQIRPILPLRSRDLVTEAMLMAGKGLAVFALDRGIPFPFSTQEPPSVGVLEAPTTLSEMYALRRSLRRSQMSSLPAPHAGLGLQVYAQVTSPLRRYLDLVAHQQLRAYLGGQDFLDSQALVERVGAADFVTGEVRQAERLSRQHWTMVYLMDHPNWQGKGVLVDKRDSRGTVLIPELDLEPRLHLRRDLPLDSVVRLVVTDVDLAERDVHFQVVY
jgi:exoribonuclease-2